MRVSEKWCQINSISFEQISSSVSLKAAPIEFPKSTHTRTHTDTLIDHYSKTLGSCLPSINAGPNKAEIEQRKAEF